MFPYNKILSDKIILKGLEFNFGMIMRVMWNFTSHVFSDNKSFHEKLI